MVPFPCPCLKGNLKFICTREEKDKGIVSYKISKTAKCDVCGRVEIIIKNEQTITANVKKTGNIKKAL